MYWPTSVKIAVYSWESGWLKEAEFMSVSLSSILQNCPGPKAKQDLDHNY